MSNNSDFVIEDGVLTDYKGAGGDVVIPDGVMSIGNGAFCWRSSLTGVTIPDSVTSIGESAFSGCKSLTSITIPDSVTSIGDKAFGGCKSLTSITIPDSVTSIGDGAFRGCTSLTSVTIPRGVTSIGSCVFNHCEGLADVAGFVLVSGVLYGYFGKGGEVAIPDSVTSIGDEAFRGCTSLTSITIPRGVTSIGNEAFYSCYSLTSITIPDSVTAIGSEAFRGCKSLTSITIPRGVTSIGDYAFMDCANLTSVTIPDSVTRIEWGTFNGCTSLASITIPDSVTSIGDRAFCGCKSLTSISIPDSVTSIAKEAFKDCANLTSVTIPGSVTSIGSRAFSGTPWLAGLGDWAIQNGILIKYQGSAENVTIPDSVKIIGDEAFMWCNSLMSITIPGSATSIGEGAFAFCSKLTAISVDAENPRYRSVDGVLFNKSGTELVQYPAGDTRSSYTFPDGVMEIGKYAFNRCISLTGVTIHGSVTSIGDKAFCNCISLTGITIPNSVMNIGDSAFFGCRSLTDVVIPNSVTHIGNDAFGGCHFQKFINPHANDPECFKIKNNELEKYTGAGGDVVIPNGVTRIGNSAFGNCCSLMSVVIPDSVTDIDEMAFYHCASLTSVTIPMAAFKSACFRDCGTANFHFTPENWMCTDGKLPKAMLKRVDSLDIDAESAAWLLSFQNDADAQSKLATAVSFGTLLAQNVLCAAARVIGERETPLKAAELNRVYAFALEHCAELSAQDVLDLKEACLKNSPKAVKKLDWDAVCAVEPTDGGDELEKYALANSKHPEFFAKALKVSSDSIPYADGKGCASKKTVAALLTEYAYLYEQASGTSTNIYDYEKLSVNEMAETIAEKLDRKALSAYLKGLASSSDYRPWLLSFARFATEDDMRSYCSGLSERPAKEGYRRGNAMAAMCLSDTRSAMLYLDKAGELENYARFHGTDADTLRDTILSDLGLDADGKKTYDLGGTTVTAALQADLTLSLFDTTQNKVVKSMPKKGNDEALVAAASADFAELKKNIKKVAKNRCDNLFANFLSGKEKQSGDWQKVYRTNPLLRQIANLLVWEQDGVTFTLSGKDAICADGAAYVTTNSPIKLAHPMEMKPEEVTAWQKYFNANGLKQPFAQIWEPVYDLSSVDKNRYNGIHIPAYRFSKQEKHGIWFDIDFGMNDANFGLADCELECSFKDVVMFHTEVDLKADAVLGAFEVRKPSRQANHIVSLLDKWTVYGRIMKDDVTVMEQMNGANVAQLMEYIRVANENNAVNVTAALMEYKNEHFADFDPMDDFVL